MISLTVHWWFSHCQLMVGLCLVTRKLLVREIKREGERGGRNTLISQIHTSNPFQLFSFSNPCSILRSAICTNTHPLVHVTSWSMTWYYSMYVYVRLELDVKLVMASWCLLASSWLMAGSCLTQRVQEPSGQSWSGEEREQLEAQQGKTYILYVPQ